MDATLILLVIALIVAVVLFAVSLRTAREGAHVAPREQAAAHPARATPQPGGLPAAAPRGEPVSAAAYVAPAPGTIIAPQGPPVATAQSPQDGLPVATAQSPQDGLPVATAQAETAAAPSGVPHAAPAAAPASAGPLPGTAAAERTASGQSTSVGDYSTVGYTAGTPVVRSAPPADSAAAAAQETTTAAPAGADGRHTDPTIARREAIATEQAPPQPEAPLPVAMELVGSPHTRSGDVMLLASPQRLPYRLAELLGEQRQLEEAITLTNRRIDDVEVTPDAGSMENRVRLSVLRQDLGQKQERLREILFLQDGYRWLQQHMAPDRALSAGQPPDGPAPVGSRP